MSLTLLIALVASVPFAALCWLCAAGIDRLGAGVRLRVATWTVALVLPIALIPGAGIVGALDMRSPLADLRSQLQPAAETPMKQAEVAPLPASLPWVEVALAVLALGAAARLGGLWIAGLRVTKAVERSTPVDNPLFSGLTPVRQTECATPVLAGLSRPVILIPRRLLMVLPSEQVALICAHEQSHLAAGDHIAHLLEEIAVRAFWFNLPLIAIRARLTAAREEACDARVLTSCDDQARRVYAQCLLAAFRVAGDEMAVMAFTGHGNDEAKRRLSAILHPRAGTAPAMVLACAAGLSLVAGAGGLSVALAAQPMPVVNTLTRAIAANLTGSAPVTAAPVTAPGTVPVGASRSRHKLSERAERPEQPERAELPERPELPERAELPERPEQPERPEIPERPEQPERPEVAAT